MRSILTGVALLFLFVNSFAQTTTFPTGSYIINMGVVPQTVNNALKPYGLIYDLMKNNQIPVNWVISQTKVKDGADFTYNGVAYKGGTFIVSAGFITAAVTAKFTSYGVTYAVTNSDLTVDVTYKLAAAPKWTLDDQNGAIAAGWFPTAGVPSTAYNWKDPQTLGGCDDIFVMPHADPTWATHSNLYNWNRTQFGAIWAGCHAVSVLENMNNGTLQTNYLANNVGSIGNALVLWTAHTAGSPPYILQHPTVAGAQFMGITDAAHQNGSEQVYLPKKGGSWRATTKIISYDPTQANVPTLSDGPAAIIAWGRGFGLNTSGWVMYEAGHNIGKAVAADNIAAQRAFWDFSLLSSVDKVPYVTSTSVPSTMQVNQNNAVSVTAVSPVGIGLTYLWKATLNGTPSGTFASPTSASTTFKPTVAGNYVITCLVSDACNRTTFSSTSPVKASSGPSPPTLVADVATIVLTCGTGVVAKNVLANDTDPDGGTITLSTAPTLVAPAKGTISWTAAGLITFTSFANVSGTQVINYTAINTGGQTASSTFTITIGAGSTPTPVNDAFTIVEDSIGRFNVVSNDGGGVTVKAITIYPTNGKASLNIDQTISYIPNVDYFGNDTVTYQVENASGNTATARLVVTVTNNSCDGGTYSSSNSTGTVTYSAPTQDASIRFEAVKEFGATNALVVDATVGATNRSLLKFSLSSIPSGATITAAELRLVRKGGNGTTQTITANRVTTNWNQGTRDNQDATLASNGATYTGPNYTTNWSNRGGDFTTTNSASTSVTGNATYAWNVTTITQGWYAGTFSNFGFLMKDLTESASNDKSFGSFDAGAGDRPKLRVTYTPSGGSSTVVDLDATEDTYIVDVHGKVYGDATTYQIDSKIGSEERLLIKFDAPTGIPSGATVTSATLKLTRTGGDNTSQRVAVHRLTKTWNEAADDNKVNTSGLNGATWRANTFTTLWSAPGGDFGVASTDSVSIPVSNSTGGTGGTANYNWNVQSIVQNWVNTPANNHGFMVKAKVESSAINLQQIFGMRENGTAANRPTLIVNYSSNTCTTIPNRAPLLNPDAGTTMNGVAVNIPTAANDYFITAGTKTYAILVQPGNGSASINSSGIITYTPSGTFNGTTTMRYTASVNGLLDTASVTCTVTNSPIDAVNDAPTGQNSNVVQTIAVKGNDTDLEGQVASATVTISTAPKYGTAIVSSGQIQYTPGTNYTGKDTLYYSICEPAPGCGDAICDTARVIINVINQPPSAPSVNQSFNACTGKTLNLLSFITDPEGGTLTVTSVSALSTPAAGTLTNHGDGTVTFVPAGSATYPVYVHFTFQVTDNGISPAVATDTVFITVNNSVNNSPVAVIDRPDSFYFDELLYYEVRDNDSDPEGGNLTNPTITQQGAHGTVTVEASGLLKYTPSGSYVGTDFFIYQVCDSAVNSATCAKSVGLCDTAIVYVKMIQRPIQLSGFVYNDVNGLNGAPANTVDGTGIGSLTATPLYAYLVNGSGNVVDVTPVGAVGDFLFNNVIGGGVTYSTRISTLSVAIGQTAPAVTLPSGWSTTGEYNGSGAGNDGSANGILPSITVNTSSISTLKFGVEELPTPADITNATQTNPGGTAQVTVASTTFAGSDPSSGGVSGSISSIKITAFPTNTTTIVINGTSYTSGTFPGAGVSVPTNAAGEPTQTITVDPSPAGATTVSIPYVVVDLAGYQSLDTGSADLPFGTSLSLTGRVYNDIDGISATGVDNLSGLGNPSGATLYANLIDGSNNVVATVTVSINGTYTFPVVTNGTYSVQISQNQGVVSSAAPATLLPDGWVNTGEKLGTGAGGTDGTPNGILPGIVVSGASVANANFGIEKLPIPTTETAISVVNPGGTTQVSVASTLFGATDEGTGTIDSIRITSFPTNATTIVINSVSYTSGTFPVGGVAVPTNATGEPSQTITIDPIDGAVTSVISFTARDNAGKYSTVVGTANVPFFTVGISGNVLNDADGLTDNTVDGTGLGNPEGTTLYANLLNGSNVVVATVTVNANGTYTFPIVNPGSYSVQISRVQGVVSSGMPATTLPTNWNFMGENLGTLSGNDGTPNGRLTGLTVVNANLTEANFGINKAPVAHDKIYSGLDSADFMVGSGNAQYPYGIPLNAVSGTSDGNLNVSGGSYMPGKLSGVDNEDGKYAGSTGGDRATLQIQTPPDTTDGVLVYNGVLLKPYPGTGHPALAYWNATLNKFQIPNFDNDLLSYFFKFNGQTGFNFQYGFVDAGGTLGDIADYQAGSNGPLPIVLTRFDAVKGDAINVWLNWETSSEVNNSHFVVERSGNGIEPWKDLGTVEGRGNSTTRSTYKYEDQNPFIGDNFYRLKQVDFDGKYEYSPIRLVNFEKVSANNISVYPNPSNGEVTVSIQNVLNAGETRIMVSDVTGRVLINKNYPMSEEGAFEQKIDLKNFETGYYEVTVFSKDVVNTFKILKQ